MKDTTAARLCAQLIKKGVAKGVKLRPGAYSMNAEGGGVQACAIGSIEHALQRGRVSSPVTFDSDTMVKDIRTQTGLTSRQLRAMERGFEHSLKSRASNPLFLLGRRLRARFIERLSKREREDGNWA